MKTERKAYLDNIRWITVLLVTVYHVGYLFNGVGVLGGIPNAKHLAVWDGFLYIVYPWFMVLLFLVSGICARYALEGKTNQEFLRDRRDRLLVPSTSDSGLERVSGALGRSGQSAGEALPC